jgi:hypothetical protein
MYLYFFYVFYPLFWSIKVLIFAFFKRDKNIKVFYSFLGYLKTFEIKKISKRKRAVQ